MITATWFWLLVLVLSVAAVAYITAAILTEWQARDARDDDRRGDRPFDVEREGL